MELTSWALHSSLERERKFRRHLFTFSIKRDTRQRNVQKCVMQVQT